MAKKTGRTRNFNEKAIVGDGVALSTNVAVKVLDAVKSTDPRMYVAITITTRSAWLRLMPAAEEPTVRKGILLLENGTYEMTADSPYLGEISIINTKNNDKPKFYVTTY